jgi:hypothetical protein
MRITSSATRPPIEWPASAKVAGAAPSTDSAIAANESALP